ncbi:type III pantothenate kinase [Allomuricauda sp. d1]|uniref:type III pantothenate kinase n=1 Tax=Allomuricauda sp. d1 TaxID=3136725 RepID=UPI0031D391F1
MNLIIDIGNTLVKFAVFDGGKLIHDESRDADDLVNSVKEIFKKFPKIRHAILSAVGSSNEKDVDVVKLFCNTHVLSHTSKVPFKNSYATPQTLGVDRIALATAAFYHNHGGNTLVIDAGTCITYDMINDYGEYLGGAISPGVSMRYRAMHDQTAQLPLLKAVDYVDLIGNSTETSMHSGVINGVAKEVDGVVDQYRLHFKHLTVILTGGEAHFFAKKLKNTIFANSKFLLEGLNYLLEYNKT